jgi:hypothetical protein
VAKKESVFGRKPIDPDDVRNDRVTATLTKDEKERVKKVAARAGKSASDWARDVILAALKDS